MKQTSNMQRGFLFDYKWIPALRDLEPQDFHIIFWQLLDFQQSNGRKKIPRHRGRRDLDHITNLLVPQIENRLNGFVGGHTAHGCSAPEGGMVPPTVPPAEEGIGAKISQDKLSQDKISQAEMSQVESGESGEGATSLGGAFAAYGGTHTDSQEAEPVGEDKQAYGDYGNVYLTPTQYKILTETEGIPSAYIDRYSRRLTQGNYHPADHAATIRTWWGEDKETFTARSSGGGEYGSRPSRDPSPAGRESSFDVDTFFEDAVRRSLGEG